jgi:tryptophanyl-tRNA synthetase
MLMENIASINPKASALREQKVTPWEVEAADERGVDYDKLIEQFGTRKIDQSLLERLENLTGRKPHRYLRRGLFFSHRYRTCCSVIYSGI